MGLDSMWSGAVEGKFNVCGGIFSGNGNSSFRGKVYNTIVEEITGVSLYQDEISNDQVNEMAKKLAEADWSRVSKIDSEITQQEFNNLAAMFILHGKAGHVLRGWW